MPLTVRDLLAIPSLRLRIVAGRAGLGGVVEAAHASEMLRPAAWLEGGEVVMTTGLLLAETCAEGGVVGGTAAGATDTGSAAVVRARSAPGTDAGAGPARSAPQPAGLARRAGTKAAAGSDRPSCRADAETAVGATCPEHAAGAVPDAGGPNGSADAACSSCAAGSARSAAACSACAACVEYAEDVAAGGAVALLLGLGPSLPLRYAPRALIDAAERLGLPLLTAPEQTPFVAVTKAVFGARAAEERRLLERTVRTQRQLTAVTASGGGLDALLRAWRQATGSGVVVCDALGRLLGAAGADGPAALAEARGMLDVVALRGLRGSADGDLPSGRVQVQPLGGTRLRGFMLLLGADGAESRLLSSVLVSLLSVELERRHLADEPHRRRRAQLLDRLLRPDLTSSQARALTSAAGLRAAAVRGVAVAIDDGVPPLADEVAADLATALSHGLVRAAGTTIEAVVGDGADVEAVLRRFAAGRPAGIGPPVLPQHAALSLRQARALLPASRELGRPATAAEVASVRLLLRLGGREVLTAFADTVLAPLDAHENADALLDTLRVWLETNGSWAETAALLGLHRHTVQSRVERVGRLTGRRMDRAEDRVDLWLALHTRQSAPPPDA